MKTSVMININCLFLSQNLIIRKNLISRMILNITFHSVLDKSWTFAGSNKKIHVQTWKDKSIQLWVIPPGSENIVRSLTVHVILVLLVQPEMLSKCFTKLLFICKIWKFLIQKYLHYNISFQKRRKTFQL